MNRNILSALLLGGSLVLGACDNSPPPPPSATPKNQGGLSGLADNPTSVLGKSAAMGRDSAKGIEAAQAQASGLADEISGQATVLMVAGLEFRPPTAWTKTVPASSMQAAAFKAGNADCAFLAGIGGGVAENVERWKKAVTDGSGAPADLKVRSQTVQGIKITMVTGEGTYSSMVSGTPTPKPGTGFRGAIVEGPQGLVFVRLTGPVADVVTATPAWEQLVLSVRKP